MSDAASAAAPCPVVRARSILQKVRYDGNEWFGIDYNMNLYRGCCHGCIYCDSRSECYRIDDFDQVSVKFDALAILQRELRSRRVRGIVGVGAMSDTYNPFERTLRVTRGALELIGIRLRRVGGHEEHAYHARHRRAERHRSGGRGHREDHRHHGRRPTGAHHRTARALA